jgi:hypothetical protein
MAHKNNFDDCRYPWDVERIVKIAAANGVVLSPKEAEKAWEENSDNMCAGWLCLPASDDSVWLELPAWARGLQGE